MRYWIFSNSLFLGRPILIGFFKSEDKAQKAATIYVEKNDNVRIMYGAISDIPFPIFVMKKNGVFYPVSSWEILENSNLWSEIKELEIE